MLWQPWAGRVEGIRKRFPSGEAGITRGRATPSSSFYQVYELTGLPSTWPKILFDRYGTRAQEVGAFMAADDDAPLVHKPDMTRREITFLVQREKIVHLDDLLLRRTMLAYLGQLSRPLVEELAEVLGQALGWPASKRQEEITRALGVLADDHGVQLEDV